jgi:HTH-type transcriptional regulator / antitoxin HipB
MIKNEKQYKITKKILNGIIQKITKLNAENDQLKNELILIPLTDMSLDLGREIEEYDNLKKDKAKILKARSLSELPSLITEYKIASGLTQKEFSEKIGMKEQQIQRYEAENFQGISFKNLLKILQAIGLNVIIKDTPIQKISKKEAADNQSIA